MTGFLQQQPAGATAPQTQLQTITSTTSGVQEIPLDMKAIHDHMAVQALVRSYQVSISLYELAFVFVWLLFFFFFSLNIEQKKL